uniref:CSON010558 protein n=1 Tax=Culicoides sonorensis TaxID=179676 RepID=A0A336N418_CULSO
MNEIIKFQRAEEVEFIKKRSVEALVKLCKLAFDCIKSGFDEEKNKVVAENFGQTPEFIKTIVEILLEFLIDAVKFNWNENNLQPLINNYNFNAEQISVLSQFVESKREIIETLLKQNQAHDLRFRQLEWRLEARIASRSLHSQAVPLVTMKLHLDSETCPEKLESLHSSDNPNSTKREIIMQTDPNNLVHIIDQLEQALQESRTHRTRNFVKAFKQ